MQVTLDEIRVNAIFAALHEREHRLAGELARLTAQPATRNREYAMDCVAMAIQHCYLARRSVSAALPEDMVLPAIEEPWSESEMAWAAGR